MAEGVEARRLGEARRGVAWKEWGPYLSERQWGTVREDYSDNGDAWSYFSHDQARSRAYKWGEDGIAGICDDHQRLCLAFAVWNGVDPILKERMFGLTNAEGNHGEDVKEYYFYLDATPTSSYLKYRYRYPLDEYPYADLLRTNAEPRPPRISSTSCSTRESSTTTGSSTSTSSTPRPLRTTSTSASPCRIAARHRRTCTCSRRCGSATRGGWTDRRASSPPATRRVITVSHPELGELELRCEGEPQLLFTENETNTERLWGTPNATPFVKDAFHRFVDRRPGRRRQPRPDGHQGRRLLPGSPSLPKAPRRSGCGCAGPAPRPPSRQAVSKVFADRVAEADEFYASITPAATPADQVPVLRQALAGMLWGKQFYFFDLDRWLEEHHAHPLRDAGRSRPAATAAGSTWSTTT